MLKLLHRLFPGLHRYTKKRVSLVMDDGVITPTAQAVCSCGDKQPLGYVALDLGHELPVDRCALARAVYDETSGWVITPGGRAKYVHFDPTTGLLTVEHDFTHLVEYPGHLVYPILEG